MARTKRITNKPLRQQEKEEFLQQTSALFLEHQGVELWTQAEQNLFRYTDTIDRQVVFEMGLRLGWKAALRAALSNSLPDPKAEEDDDHVDGTDIQERSVNQPQVG